MSLTWLYMSLVTVIFLVFSAVMWRVIQHADTEPGARGANRMTPARAITVRDADEPKASGRQAA